jgi:hypothetical protein
MLTKGGSEIPKENCLFKTITNLIIKRTKHKNNEILNIIYIRVINFYPYNNVHKYD